MNAARRYSSILRTAWWPILGWMLSATSVGLKALAALFLLRDAGYSYQAIGFVLAADMVGSAVGMPVQGRLLDRLGFRRFLPPLVLLHVELLAAFTGGTIAGWSLPVLIALTFAWGVTTPLTGSGLRVMLSTIYEGDDRDAALALQAVLTEVIFIAGPLLASGLALLASPVAAMAVATVLTGVGTLLFAVTVLRRPVTAEQAAEARTRGFFDLVRGPSMPGLLGASLLMGLSLGALEILTPAFAERGGSTESSGVGFAAIAVGSIIGGLLYGSRSWRWGLRDRFVGTMVLLGVALLPLALELPFALVCVVLAIAGLALAPADAAIYALADDATDDASAVEASGWIGSLFNVGLGVGTAASGVVVTGHGIGAAALMPGLIALVAAVIVARTVAAAIASPAHDEHEAPHGSPQLT